MLQRRRRVFAVDTISRCDNPADDLLVGWKDIASYLKCSVRKAQRLERQELPVNRIRGTKSVWASKSGIDRWLILQSEAAKRTVQRPSDTRIIPSGKNATVCRLVALALMLGLTIAAGAASAYGITIVLFGATVAVLVVSYPCLPDSVYTRAGVGLFLIAGMSYGTSAASLPNTRSIGTYRPLFSWCCIIYLLIGLTAAIVNRHSYDISIFHLDAKNPDTYRIRNTDVEHRFRGWLQQHSDQAGADLAALSTDSEFIDALKSKTFYKQPFDEPLQFTRKAVIFGYRIEYGPRSSRVFVLIRFPSGLAETLGFEPVRKM